MPELPEVETVKVGLAKLLPGRMVLGVEHDWDKSFPNTEVDVQAFLIGAKVIAVRRRAKVLMIDLDSSYSLIIHLKMTGQLVYVDDKSKVQSSNIKDQINLKHQNSKTPTSTFHLSSSKLGRFGGGHPGDSLIGELPDRSTRVVLELDGANLFFNDQRKFGWIKLLPTSEVKQLDFFRKFGPEPLSPDFTGEAFARILDRRARSSIKAALIDQTVVAGVGNIYADESLWAARIHPATKTYLVDDISRRRLLHELRKILRLSIEKGGSTDRNYVDAEGKKGSYLHFANVFRRDGRPCVRHPGTRIEKIRVAGRGTHICHRCQKLLFDI